MALSKTYGYYIDREKIGLIEYGGTGNDTDGGKKWQSISVSGKTIRIFCTKLADHMTAGNMDTSSGTIEHGQIPSQFHEGLTYKVISMGYKDPRNINIELAAFFEQEFQQTEKKAKKYTRKHHQTPGYITPVDY